MVHKRRVVPVQERAVAMRRTLLDSTLHLLATSDGRPVTTSAITRHAHVSSGTLYRYFNGRDEILAVLRDEAVAAISADLTRGVATALAHESATAMRAVVDTLVTAFEAHAAVLAAMIDRAPAGPNANVLPEVEADLQPLASILPRRYRPDLPDAELDAVVFVTMGVLVSTCLRLALQRPADVDRTRAIDLVAAMMVAALDAPGLAGSTS